MTELRTKIINGATYGVVLSAAAASIVLFANSLSTFSYVALLITGAGAGIVRAMQHGDHGVEITYSITSASK